MCMYTYHKYSKTVPSCRRWFLICLKNHCNVYAAIFLLTFLSLPLQAQFKLSGHLINEQKEAISYVIVSINHKEDSTFVKGALSDSSGFFLLEDITPGVYVLQITGLNFPKINMGEYLIDKEDINLGFLMLKESAIFLPEVTVQVKKNFIERKSDRLIANISTSPLSYGYNALQIIDFLPGVTIDYKTNQITVNQRGDVLILIDGIGSRQSSEAAKELLGSIDASSVDKIEIYSNPPARFDAEGGAVINIITKKKKMYSTVGGTLGNAIQQIPSNFIGEAFQSNLNANINYALSDKLRFYSRWFIRNDLGWQLSGGRGLYKATNYLMQDYTEFSSESRIIRYSTGINWEFKPKNYIVAEFGQSTNIFGKNLMIYSQNEINFSDASRSKTIDSTLTFSRETWRDFNEYNFSLGYSKAGEKEDISVQLEYSSKQDQRNSLFSNSFLNASNDNKRTEVVDPYRGLRSKGLTFSFDSNSNNFLGTDLQFNKGLKIINLNYLEDNILLMQLDTFKYRESIYAAYLETAWEKEKIAWKLGVRTEFTDWVAPSEALDRNYWGIFPSMSFLYRLNEQRSLGISFSRRIARPWISELNSFIQYSSPVVGIRGNPTSLLPRYYNVLEFNAVLGEVAITLSANQLDNQRISFPYQQDGLVINYEFISVKFERELFANIFFPIQINKWWKIDNELAGFYITTALIAAQQAIGGTGYYINQTHSFQVSDRFDLNTFIFYNSANRSGYSRISGIFQMGISMRWQALKDKRLTISLALDDVLGTKKWNTLSDYELFQNFSEILSNERFLRLSANYKFKLGQLFTPKQLKRDQETMRFNM